MIKNFIFDVDGTLLDSNDLHAQAWSEAFAAFGKKISLARIRLCMGKGKDQLLPEFLDKKEIDKIGEALGTLSGEIFKQKYFPKVRPFPHVRALFREIRQCGARIALASSGEKDEVTKYEKIARIEDLVEKSTSSDDADESKPEPDIFRAALRILGHPTRKSVLVIGDSPFDAIAAKRAKLRTVGVLCGGFSKQSLLTNGCHLVYKDPEDLLKNLEALLKL
jgi:phosphoglycolate phosphatase-like HAD superfamily hydrolase